MNQPPLVSIVTPSFQQGRFLARTIESVLEQTYPHIEYQVIDGGSTDGTIDVLRSFGSRVRWVSEPDRGQTHAINKGFGNSHGDICAYLNSDDVLAPDAVERVVAAFQAMPDCDLLYGRAYYIDEHDKIIGEYPTAPFHLRRLAEECCICQPAVFWRREIAQAVGPFDENLRFCMDYDYWLRIARAGGRLVYLPHVLASSRMYAQTKTASNRVAIYLESMKVCWRHTRRLPLCQWRGLCREVLSHYITRYREKRPILMVNPK